MGFNAVLAAAGGARNYMARRQVDRRVILLAQLNGSPIDTSVYNSLTSSNLQFENPSPALFDNSILKSTIKASGAAAFYAPPVLDCNVWTIDLNIKTQVTMDAVETALAVGRYTLALEWNHTLHVRYDNTTLCYLVMGNAHQQVWKNFRVSCDGSKIRIYGNGLLGTTYTGSLTLPFSSGIQIGGPCEIGAARVVRNVALVTPYALPTTYYTGYEAL